MRCFGIPVVPPVSKILKGRPLYLAGTQTSGWRSRSHSSWKCGKRFMSAKERISLRGSQPDFLAQSSQKGQPVSGEKCQLMISRKCASSFSWAPLIACCNAGSLCMNGVADNKNSPFGGEIKKGFELISSVQFFAADR